MNTGLISFVSTRTSAKLNAQAMKGAFSISFVLKRKKQKRKPAGSAGFIFFTLFPTFHLGNKKIATATRSLWSDIFVSDLSGS